MKQFRFISNHLNICIILLFTLLSSCNFELDYRGTDCFSKNEKGEVYYNVTNDILGQFNVNPYEKEFIYVTDNYGRPNVICLVNVDKKNEINIATENNTIILMDIKWDEGFVYYWNFDGFIRRVNLSNKNIETLLSSVTNHSAQLSGEEIAFTRTDNNIYIYNRINDTERNVGSGYVIAFSSDEGIIYSQKYSDNEETTYYRINTNNLLETPVDGTYLSQYYYHSSWSGSDYYNYSGNKMINISQNETTYLPFHCQNLYYVTESGRYFVYLAKYNSGSCSSFARSSIFVYDYETNQTHEIAFEYTNYPTFNVYSFMNESKRIYYYHEMYSQTIYMCEF